MLLLHTFLGLILLLACVNGHHSHSHRHHIHRRRATSIDEQSLSDYLRNVYEKEASNVYYEQVVTEWNFATDVSNETKAEAQKNQTLITAEYTKKVWMEHFKGLKPDDFEDPLLKRQIFFLATLGISALDENSLAELTSLENKMTNIYSTAKVCPYKNKNCKLDKEGMSLEPDIENVMSTSTNYDELEYVWTSWRTATGAKMKNDYKRYVDISNKAAVLNGFKDMGAMWRWDYESDTFVQDMEDLWMEVKPLYEELHTYVLNKLLERYPQMNVDDGLIPAHVLGNMWAQSWINLYDLMKPYSNASVMDVTKELREQGYTVLKMFETSDEFYQSLGLEPNGICYNVSAGAMIEKPKDREVLCHASAWDFYNGKDYRIKMCTDVEQEDFVTIHHEMGHIQYYLQYKHQPITLRTGANPGFHEAVGDTIALSVATPQHLRKIGLLRDYKDSDEADLNALMNMALERVAFLPFGYLIDKWRWDVFSGDVDEKQWNDRWWQYRRDIQKVKAPNMRNEKDFDPGAKYHVPGNSQYIAYFVAHILEFQLHRALCITAGEYNPNDPKTKPLHQCDIYQSKEAGAKLSAGLSLGASRHWSEALEAMTGERNLSGSAIIEYFKPLYDYLVAYNRQHVQAEKVEMLRDKPDKVDVADDQIIPIVVGGVIGTLALIGVVTYLVMRRRK